MNKFVGVLDNYGLLHNSKLQKWQALSLPAKATGLKDLHTFQLEFTKAESAAVQIFSFPKCGWGWGVNKARVPTPSFLPQTRNKAIGLTQCIQTYSLIIGGSWVPRSSQWNHFSQRGVIPSSQKYLTNKGNFIQYLTQYSNINTVEPW